MCCCGADVGHKNHTNGVSYNLLPPFSKLLTGFFFSSKKKKKFFFCQTYISRLPLNFSLSIHVESTKMKSRLLPVHLHWPAFIVQNDNIYLSFLIHTFLFTNIQLVLRSCCFSPCTSDNCLFLSVHGTNMPLLTLMSWTLFLCTELKELLWIHDLLDHA